MDINELKNIATQVRRDIIRMVHGAKSGHPGGSLGCADFLTALYFQTMDIDPANFTKEGTGEDMFFLSNGHISPVLYSVMARRGYFPVDELAEEYIKEHSNRPYTVYTADELEKFIINNIVIIIPLLFSNKHFRFEIRH